MSTGDSKDAASEMDRDRVIHIFGPIDDDTIVRILATGASEAELHEARERLERPGEVAAEMQRSPVGVVAEVIEIVQSAEPEADAPRDGE